MEVLEAKGDLIVGYAGTSLGPQCNRMGDDACSWSFFMGDGDGRHRCVLEGCCRGEGVGC